MTAGAACCATSALLAMQPTNRAVEAAAMPVSQKIKTYLAEVDERCRTKMVQPHTDLVCNLGQCSVMLALSSLKSINALLFHNDSEQSKLLKNQDWWFRSLSQGETTAAMIMLQHSPAFGCVVEMRLRM